MDANLTDVSLVGLARLLAKPDCNCPFDAKDSSKCEAIKEIRLQQSCQEGDNLEPQTTLERRSHSIDMGITVVTNNPKKRRLLKMGFLDSNEIDYEVRPVSEENTPRRRLESVKKEIPDVDEVQEISGEVSAPTKQPPSRSHACGFGFGFGFDAGS